MISFRRGLFLGVLVSAITAVAGRLSDINQSTTREMNNRGISAVARARRAAQEERLIAERRLRDQYRRARQSGHVSRRDD